MVTKLCEECGEPRHALASERVVAPVKCVDETDGLLSTQVCPCKVAVIGQEGSELVQDLDLRGA